MLPLYRNIKARRTELKMSQDTLAELTGYKDRSSIAKIEKGDVDLSESKIREFAKALRISPQELMGWEDADEPSTFDTEYYLNQQTAEMAEFLMKNPQYQVLFDASRKVKPEDIEKALTALGLFSE